MSGSAIEHERLKSNKRCGRSCGLLRYIFLDRFEMNFKVVLILFQAKVNHTNQQDYLIFLSEICLSKSNNTSNFSVAILRETSLTPLEREGVTFQDSLCSPLKFNLHMDTWTDSGTFGHLVSRAASLKLKIQT